MTNNSERNKKHHYCLNCGEQFGPTEFFDYMVKLRSTTIDCYKCPAENYLVPTKNLRFHVIRLLCFTLIILAAWFMLRETLVSYPLNFSETTAPGIGKNYVILLAVAIGMGGGLAYLFYRINMKIYIWHNGWLSMDKEHKSVTDYE